jgi:hypothetical protein
MLEPTKFSAIPVGELFEYKGRFYNRFTHERGKQELNGRMVFTHFPKHRIVNRIINEE